MSLLDGRPGILIVCTEIVLGSGGDGKVGHRVRRLGRKQKLQAGMALANQYITRLIVPFYISASIVSFGTSVTVLQKQIQARIGRPRRAKAGFTDMKLDSSEVKVLLSSYYHCIHASILSIIVA